MRVGLRPPRWARNIAAAREGKWLHKILVLACPSFISGGLSCFAASCCFGAYVNLFYRLTNNKVSALVSSPTARFSTWTVFNPAELNANEIVIISGY